MKRGIIMNENSNGVISIELSKFDIRAGKTYPMPPLRIGKPSLNDVYAGIVNPVKPVIHGKEISYVKIQPIFTKETYTSRTRRTGYHKISLLSVGEYDPRDTMKPDFEIPLETVATGVVTRRVRVEFMRDLKRIQEKAVMEQALLQVVD